MSNSFSNTLSNTKTEAKKGRVPSIGGDFGFFETDNTENSFSATETINSFQEQEGMSATGLMSFNENISANSSFAEPSVIENQPSSQGSNPWFTINSTVSEATQFISNVAKVAGGVTSEVANAGGDILDQVTGRGEYKVTKEPVQDAKRTPEPQDAAAKQAEETAKVQPLAIFENEKVRVTQQTQQKLFERALQIGVNFQNLGELLNEPNRKQEELLTIRNIVLADEKQKEMLKATEAAKKQENMPKVTTKAPVGPTASTKIDSTASEGSGQSNFKAG